MLGSICLVMMRVTMPLQTIGTLSETNVSIYT